MTGSADPSSGFRFSDALCELLRHQEGFTTNQYPTWKEGYLTGIITVHTTKDRHLPLSAPLVGHFGVDFTALGRFEFALWFRAARKPQPASPFRVEDVLPSFH